MQHRIEELETRKKQHQAHAGNLETEGAGLDEQLEKFRSDLNSAVTNKQYSPRCSPRLNTVKDMRGKLDDSILEEMTAIEELEKEIAEVTAQLEERNKVCEGAQAQLDERKRDVGDKLARTGAFDREEAAQKGAGPACWPYSRNWAKPTTAKRSRRSRKSNRRRREYACGACNIQLPFEKIALLTGSVTDVVTLPRLRPHPDAAGRHPRRADQVSDAFTKERTCDADRMQAVGVFIWVSALVNRLDQDFGKKLLLIGVVGRSGLDIADRFGHVFERLELVVLADVAHVGDAVQLGEALRATRRPISRLWTSLVEIPLKLILDLADEPLLLRSSAIGRLPHAACTPLQDLAAVSEGRPGAVLLDDHQTARLFDAFIGRESFRRTPGIPGAGG